MTIEHRACGAERQANTIAGVTLMQCLHGAQHQAGSAAPAGTNDPFCPCRQVRLRHPGGQRLRRLHPTAQRPGGCAVEQADHRPGGRQYASVLGASHLASRPARARARFFGASSPPTICTPVAITNPAAASAGPVGPVAAALAACTFGRQFLLGLRAGPAADPVLVAARRPML